MSPRPAQASARAALMLQLVPYLVAKDEVSLAEAAADFDVSPEQMRRMVQQLTMIGRPGDAGYWQMPNDLFDIDWELLEERDTIVITNTVALERAPKLTAREAAALLAGLQLARALPGVASNEVVNGLLAKLEKGAASAPADVIVVPPPVDAVRVAVDEALQSGVALSFTYKAPEAAPTTRTVDPVKVHIANGEWYLQGWCHLRQAMRTFHLDRVSDARLTDIPITHGDERVPALFAPGENDIEVRVRFADNVLPLLGGYFDRAVLESEGGITTATLQVADEHSLKRLAARRGGAIEIVSPPAARCAAAAWAEAGLAQYG